jgi:hypothetical protein
MVADFWKYVTTQIPYFSRSKSDDDDDEPESPEELEATDDIDFAARSYDSTVGDSVENDEGNLGEETYDEAETRAIVEDFL